MLITPDHLRQHGIEKHSVKCTRDLCDDYGIDFRDFVKNGVDHTALLQAAKDRSDVAEFFRFMGLEAPPGDAP
jgi:hypothetical protein